MEEKKLDINSIIGFLLIGAILLYMLWQNQPTPEELAAQEQAKQEQLATEAAQQAADALTLTDNTISNLSTDSLALARMKTKIGDFAYALSLPSATDTTTTFENEVLALKIDNKGGFISEVKLKNYVNHDSVPVYLIKDGSSVFNLNFATSDNRTLNSSNLYFQPTLSTSGANQVLSMRLKVSETQFLEYRYELKPNDYMLGFSVKSQGLSNVLNTSQDVQLDWKFEAHRQDQSITFENRYTRLTYQHEGDKINKLSQTGDDDEVESELSWISFRQHFFSTILVPDTPFKTAELKSFNLVNDETVDTLFTKRYEVQLPLGFSGGELTHNMNIYYGPTYDDILNKYDRNLEASIPFGWGIFGWINKAIFSPLYAWLTNYLSY
jgi:YidC/Oxa1 family membrane protein insertase